MLNYAIKIIVVAWLSYIKSYGGGGGGVAAPDCLPTRLSQLGN